MISSSLEVRYDYIPLNPSFCDFVQEVPPDL